MNSTKRRTIGYILTVLAILAVTGTVLGAVTLYYEMPVNFTIEETTNLSMYVNNNAWTNESSVNFGTLAPGEQTQKNFSIKNTGNVAIRIGVVPSGLPSNCHLTFSHNGSICQPSNWLNGTLTLTVSNEIQSAMYYCVLGIYIT